MNIRQRMFGKRVASEPTSGKNPNRVSGGIRGSGQSHYVIVGEDGLEKRIPSQKYIESLEQQLREQKMRIAALEKKISRLGTDSHTDRR